MFQESARRALCANQAHLPLPTESHELLPLFALSLAKGRFDDLAMRCSLHLMAEECFNMTLLCFALALAGLSPCRSLVSTLSRPFSLAQRHHHVVLLLYQFTCIDSRGIYKNG